MINHIRAALLSFAFGSVLTLPVFSAVQLTSLVSDQAALVVSVHDAPGLIKNWDRSPWAKTWNDEQVMRFFAPLRAQMKIDEWDESCRKETGYTVREMMSLATGDAMLVLPNIEFALQEDHPGTPAFLIAVEVGGNASKIDGLLAKARKADNTVEETEEFAGVTVHIEKERDPGEHPQGSSAVWALDDGIWLIGMNKEVVIGAIDAIKRGGVANPLGQADRYLKMKGRVGNAQVIFYANVQAIYPTLKQMVEKKAAGKPNSMGPDPKAMLSAFGLDAINEFYGAVHIGENDTETSGAITTTDNKGILKLMALKEGPVPQPKFVSANWVSVSVSKFSIREAYEGLEEILENVSPAISGMVQGQIRAYNKQLGVDLKRDLIGSMGDTFVSAQALQPGAGANDKKELQQMFVVSLTSPEAFTNAIEALKRMAGPEPDKVFVKRAYLGQTIVTFAPPVPAGAPGSKGFSYSIAGGYFFFSVGNSAILETALQGLTGDQPSFWQKADVKRALAEAPSTACTFQFQDIRAMMSALFDNLAAMGAMAARQPQATPVPAGGDNGDEAPKPAEPKPNKAFVDPNAKPDAAVIGKYWSYGYGTAYRDSTGVYFQSKIIYPK